MNRYYRVRVDKRPFGSAIEHREPTIAGTVITKVTDTQSRGAFKLVAVDADDTQHAQNLAQAGVEAVEESAADQIATTYRPDRIRRTPVPQVIGRRRSAEEDEAVRKAKEAIREAGTDEAARRRALDDLKKPVSTRKPAPRLQEKVIRANLSRFRGAENIVGNTLQAVIKRTMVAVFSSKTAENAREWALAYDALVTAKKRSMEQVHDHIVEERTDAGRQAMREMIGVLEEEVADALDRAGVSAERQRALIRAFDTAGNESLDAGATALDVELSNIDRR